MSKLPITPVATGTAKVGGTDVPIRSLTREEARRFVEAEGGLPSEVIVLTSGVGVTEDEAREWLSTVDFPTGTGLVTDILRLSGLLAPEDPEKAKDPTTGSAATS